MQKITYNNYIESLSRIHPHEYNQVMLNKLAQLMCYASSTHNKIYFTRLDMTFPKGYGESGDNVRFRSFMASLIRFYSRRKLDPLYFWAREQNDSPVQHYHLVLLLNGDKIQSYPQVMLKAEELWGSALDREPRGLVHWCSRGRFGDEQQNGIMIRRYADTFTETFDHCLEWASYLAKNYSKGNAPQRIREFGMSRIPASWDAHPTVEALLARPPHNPF